MRSNRKKNRIILLVVLLLVISIGYAFVYTDLKIDGIANVTKQTWDVHFENIHVSEGSVTPVHEATINSQDTTKVSYEVYLENPGDYYEFTVDAVNAGTIDAMITDISSTNNSAPIDLPTYIIYNTTYESERNLEVNHLLRANSHETYLIGIYFDDDINSIELEDSQPLNLRLVFDVTYSQADSNAVDPNNGRIRVTFDANGGNCNKRSMHVDNGSTYGSLPTPTRIGYTFVGWEAIPTSDVVPNEYEKVSYVESTGIQYIMTDIVVDDDIGLYTVIEDSSTHLDTVYFGSNGGNSRFWAGSNNDVIYVGWNGITYNDGYDGSRVTIQENYLNSRANLVGDYVVNTNLETHVENPYPITIFAGNEFGTIKYNASIKLYDLKISRGTNIEHNYIPCYEKSTGIAGLYDTIDNEFYSTSNGTYFAYGNQVVDNNTIVYLSEPHILRAKWKHEETKFKTGSEFNIAIKTLSGQSNPSADTRNQIITAIRRYEGTPDIAILNNDAVIVSTNDSIFPIYAWYDNGTIYYFSQSNHLKFNEDSSQMFDKLSSLTTLDISSIDSSNVTNMYAMFRDLNSIQTLDLSFMNTSNVINMQSMFSNNYSSNLTTLNLSSFDTRYVSNIQWMFYRLNSLTSLDLSSFDLSNVVYTDEVFYEANSLNYIITPKKYATNSTSINIINNYTDGVNTYNRINKNTPTSTRLDRVQ